MPKKVLIALPPLMLEQVDFIAQTEHRTRSDLIREALRRYLDNFRRQAGAPLTVSTLEKPAQPAAPTPAPQVVQVGPPTAEHGEVRTYGTWNEEGK